jgi:hypothetical protein
MSSAVMASAAAAEEARRRREEEEDMTDYRHDELEGDWEFKILRSTKNVFRDPQELRRILDEEAAAAARACSEPRAPASPRARAVRRTTSRQRQHTYLGT